jgi:hypothetical protein
MCWPAITGIGTFVAVGSHCAEVGLHPLNPLIILMVAFPGSNASGSKFSPIHSSLPSHLPAPDRVPPARETSPYQGARKLGSISVRELVRVHDDRDIFPALPNELLAIDIHGL